MQKGRALNIGQRTPWTAIKITWTIPVSVASQECAVELDPPIFCINIKTVREQKQADSFISEKIKLVSLA